jgi:hypothetical protein
MKLSVETAPSALSQSLVAPACAISSMRAIQAAGLPASAKRLSA